jgi:hypothetical protein
MKRVFFLLMILSVSLSISSCGGLDSSLEIIESVRKEFAPDNRVAVFQVTAERESGRVLLRGETNLPQAMSTLEARLKEKGISFMNEVRVLPDREALDNRCWGVITVSVANIRVTPANSAEMATQAILGTPVRLYKKNEKGSYYYVQTPDGYLGWIDNGSVQPMNDKAFESWKESSRILFLEDYGYVYSSPDDQSRRVSDLVAGSILVTTGQKNGYLSVVFPDGRKGYVSEKKSMNFDRWLATRNPTPENIIETSYRYMGTPYLWGGTSTKMMDCSGFIKTVFFLNGIILPRDASQQVLEGTLLTENVDELSNVPPASLVFFGRRATDNSPWRVWHVGLWLGNGMMIHEDGPLKIESLNPDVSPFNQKRYETFYSARDFLNAIGKGYIIPVAKHDWYVNQKR